MEIIIVLLFAVIICMIFTKRDESGENYVSLKDKEEYYIEELCKICEHLKIDVVNVCDIAYNYYSLWYSFDSRTKTVTKSIIRRDDDYKIISEYTNETFMTKDLYKKFVKKCTNQ